MIKNKNKRNAKEQSGVYIKIGDSYQRTSLQSLKIGDIIMCNRAGDPVVTKDAISKAELWKVSMTYTGSRGNPCFTATPVEKSLDERKYVRYVDFVG